MKIRNSLYLILVLSLLIVGLGGYFVYDKFIKQHIQSSEKVYILDSAKTNQVYNLKWFEDSTDYGYIKLGNKEYKASFIAGNGKDLIKIGEEEFDHSPGDELYLLPNALLILHSGSDAWLTILDANLNVIFEETNIVLRKNHDQTDDFMDWNQEIITYYRQNNARKEIVNTYQIKFDFTTNNIEEPKFIYNYAPPFTICEGECA